MHRHGIRAQRLRVDPEPLQQRPGLLQHRNLRRRRDDHDRNQHPLTLQRAALHASQQLFVQNPFMQRVLVDDLQAVLSLHHQIAVVQLQRTGRDGECPSRGDGEITSPGPRLG